ncbi:MAG: DNA-directed RNA polymerase subunit beta' [Candidatus Tyloplasma litorale]|nr:MAG: DNA-directed RNA polymerase subunit beta' [Mycoplasmatales bacterium]
MDDLLYDEKLIDSLEKDSTNEHENIDNTIVVEKDSEIKKVQISLATSEDILSWSSGEVKRAETINYKTHKPEKDGLFDEKIFGPTKDYKCPVCGKKFRRSDAGKKCSSCGEAVIESKMMRRRKMGHISLAAPVAHIWFSKVNYSTIRQILGLKQDELNSVIYFRAPIIIDDGGLEEIKVGQIISLQKAASTYRKILKVIEKNTTNENIKKRIQDKIDELLKESQSEEAKEQGIDFYEYNTFITRFSKIKIKFGAEAIRDLLEKKDLKAEIELINKTINNSKSQTGISSYFRRLKTIESFIISKQNPGNMILDVLPVIPADLRPLIQLDGGRHSTVDLNELYRRVIIRNNRLKHWIEIGAPDLIVQNEKRMLQESVDALFDNTRKQTPVKSKDNRDLKSLAENLKGKQGRFRQNLLGKRVDYSGRSVIVVGPELKLHQVGLPKQMVVKLFEPFIVQRLVEEKVVKSIKQAKKLIEVYDDRIWTYATGVIKEHPVLLNRAPTLHRLSIQAFEPVITSGKAIRLHPLVTPSFNADFDGDQMAVHVPLSMKAKKEARELMLSSKNILGPKDGKLILSPSQDIILGMYYLTKVRKNNIGSRRIFANFDELNNFIFTKHTHIHSIVAMPLKAFGTKFEKEMNNSQKYLVSSVGRLLLNQVLPEVFPYINIVKLESFKENDSKWITSSAAKLNNLFDEAEKTFKPFKKGDIAKIIEMVFEKNKEYISDVLDSIKSLGFKYSMISGASMSISDIIDIDTREEIISKGDKKVEYLWDMKNNGLMSDDERYQEVLKVWSNVREEIQEKLSEEISQNPDNPVFMMMDSGARGNISNFVQLAGMRGSMSKATHEYAALKRQGIIVRSTEEIPIKSSFKIGLTPFEYFLSTHGARKGLSDTATKTAESGYLTRRLVDAVQNVKLVEEDCGTNRGIEVKAIKDTRTNSEIEKLFDRIVGRFLVNDLHKGGKTIAKANEMITEDIANNIINSGINSLEIRSVLTCRSKKGVCQKCFGRDLTTNEVVNVGEAIGIISAQSIGEPGTQLTMRTFHTGGVAGVSDITQGFSRLMELVDANKQPKSRAIIAKSNGKVESIKASNENKYGQATQYEVSIKIHNTQEYEKHTIDSSQFLRVKKGDQVKPGQKITEGSIQLQELLNVAGPIETQNYLIKEMQRLYILQGIKISDKYMEVIIRQMLSKYQVVHSGDSNLFVSQIVSADEIRKVNEDLMAQNKKPAYVKQIILGVKVVPLHSESFLAAASYQRTADSLVAATIINKVDNLEGIKENIIVGNRMPVGTGIKNPQGKYNIIEEKFDIHKYDFRNPINIELNIDDDIIK